MRRERGNGYISGMNPKVDGWMRKAKVWRAELEALRKVVLETALTEEVKWRAPCYTFEGANVVMLGGYKDSCVISFVKGALLKDGKKVLTKPGENTQAARVIRIRSVGEVAKLAGTIKAYIREAIEVEKAGAKVEFKKEFEMPGELKRRLEGDGALKKAFEGLTPGRRRLYIMHVSGAKQAATREGRVEKCVPLILAGKGLDDDYKKGRKT